MPDRDKDTQHARNQRTLLTARTPPGFPQRVKAEAEARGMTVSAFIVAQVEPALPPETDEARDHGGTAPQEEVNQR